MMGFRDGEMGSALPTEGVCRIATGPIGLAGRKYSNWVHRDRLLLMHKRAHEHCVRPLLRVGSTYWIVLTKKFPIIR